MRKNSLFLALFLTLFGFKLDAISPEGVRVSTAISTLFSAVGIGLTTQSKMKHGCKVAAAYSLLAAPFLTYVIGQHYTPYERFSRLEKEFDDYINKANVLATIDIVNNCANDDALLIVQLGDLFAKERSFPVACAAEKIQAIVCKLGAIISSLKAINAQAETDLRVNQVNVFALIERAQEYRSIIDSGLQRVKKSKIYRDELPLKQIDDLKREVARLRSKIEWRLAYNFCINPYYPHRYYSYYPYYSWRLY